MSRRERPFQITKLGRSNVDKLARRVEKRARFIEDKGIQATPLTGEAVILEKEDDLAVLQRNEREYGQAVFQNQLILEVMKLSGAWLGFKNGDFIDFWQQLKNGVRQEDAQEQVRAILEGKSRIDLTQIDPERRKILGMQMKILERTPRFYRDEYDQIITEILKENPNEPVVDLVSEEVRSQSETLALLRLQIEYLKSERKKEKMRLRAQSRQKKVGLGEREIIVEIASPNVEETPQEQVSEVLEPRPFGLSDWKVYWTDVKFSDNPNHLVAMPTESEEAFVSKLEEINVGRQVFQIKTRSVASCVEMWALPEFRQRAQGSRFRRGPDNVRDWVKIPRGGVRIFVKSDEIKKSFVFFAADRDNVYQGVFAGMSS